MGSQRKPQPGDNIVTFNIPDGPLNIRVWDGGLAKDGLYMLDFVQKSTGEPVNASPEYLIYPVSSTHVALLGSGPLVSWAIACGISPIPAGAEKFTAPLGVEFRLLHRGKEVMRFLIPKVEPAGKTTLTPPTITTQR